MMLTRPSLALTNAGGAIADIFNARERGIASAIYSTAPYLGPGMPAGSTPPLAHF